MKSLNQLQPDDIASGQYFAILRGPLTKSQPTPQQMYMTMMGHESDGKESYEEDTSLCGKVFRVVAFDQPLLIAEVLDAAPTGQVMRQVGPFLVQGPSPEIPKAIELDVRQFVLGRVSDEFVAAYKKYWGTPDQSSMLEGLTTEDLNSPACMLLLKELLQPADEDYAGEQNGANGSRDSNSQR